MFAFPNAYNMSYHIIHSTLNILIKTNSSQQKEKKSTFSTFPKKIRKFSEHLLYKNEIKIFETHIHINAMYYTNKYKRSILQVFELYFFFVIQNIQ